MFKPYSDNVIFLDSEFSSLDPYKGEVLSIGLVKLNGDELYLELEYTGPVDPWVSEHIIPDLKAPKISRPEAVVRITEFVGAQKPYIITYVTPYDVIYIRKLFGSEASPFFWLPVDFSSILFGYGIDPEAYYLGDKKNFFKDIGIDTSKYREHHALDDARLLREVYLKMSA